MWVQRGIVISRLIEAARWIERCREHACTHKGSRACDSHPSVIRRPRWQSFDWIYLISIYLANNRLIFFHVTHHLTIRELREPWSHPSAAVVSHPCRQALAGHTMNVLTSVRQDDGRLSSSRVRWAIKHSTLWASTIKDGSLFLWQVDNQAGHGLAYMPYAAWIFRSKECATVRPWISCYYCSTRFIIS